MWLRIFLNNWLNRLRVTMTQPPSTRPYLIRAIHEWAIDNGFTPQILVAANHEYVSVPPEHVKDNQIVLNIHPQSVKSLEIGNEYIMCSARFSGRPFALTVPIVSVLAIYAKENGQGIAFQEAGNEPEPEPVPPPSAQKSPDGKSSDNGIKNRPSHLKLVK